MRRVGLGGAFISIGVSIPIDELSGLGHPLPLPGTKIPTPWDGWNAVTAT
jgi:hypothetical protein